MGEESKALVSTEQTEISIERLIERDKFAVAMGKAEVIAKSGLFPGLTPQQAYVKMMLAEELGIPALAAMRQTHFVKGRIGMEADLMKAVVKKHGGARFSYEETPGCCKGMAERADTGESMTVSWDTERIRRAGLADKDNYQQHEREMLRHRCDAELCRALWPDVVCGLYTSEEMQEIEGHGEAMGELLSGETRTGWIKRQLTPRNEEREARRLENEDAEDAEVDPGTIEGELVAMGEDVPEKRTIVAEKRTIVAEKESEQAGAEAAKIPRRKGKEKKTEAKAPAFDFARPDDADAAEGVLAVVVRPTGSQYRLYDVGDGLECECREPDCEHLKAWGEKNGRQADS